MTNPAGAFELVTWYDTWNELGLQNLVSTKVPLTYANRYNLAFGGLVADDGGGYTVKISGQYASAVQSQILEQRPGVVVYAGIGDDGIAAAVADNNQHQNRSSNNIVAWLKTNRYSGISIDAEHEGMSSVPEFVTQLHTSFRAAGLGIAVSVPWPASGPANLYGANAVQAFNSNVDALELQDYSSEDTPNDAAVWIAAGINPGILLGGACTENSTVQTSIPDTIAWTQFSLTHRLRGMFSWRLDNDHGLHGTDEDRDPTFTGAKAIYDAARSG